jgi:long-subunit fatty acid transport protein
MMRTALIVGILLTISASLSAQDLGSFTEVTTWSAIGAGARQMGVGGAGIAFSLDGAALVYNPAALAQMHRIEFQFGLSHQRFSNETSQRAGRYLGYSSVLNSASIDLNKTRLSTINLSIPVPTYRGSMVVGLGVNRLASFDRAGLLHLIDRNGDLLVEDYAKEFETGGIYLYSAGAGIDISPNLSLGLALNVYSGQDEYAYDYRYAYDEGGYYEESSRQITEDYIGASIKGGLLARPNSHLSIGLTMETPLDYQVKYTYIENGSIDSGGTVEPYEYADQVEYDLTRPFIFGAGAAVRFGTLTITGDAEYVDWSQSSYGDNPWMEVDNDSLAELYREVINLRGGAEYQLPQIGLALRAGVFSNPLPYQSDFIDKDRIGFTAGMGWLFDQVLLLEAAYVDGGFSRFYTAPNGQRALAKDDFRQVFLTMSYRY